MKFEDHCRETMTAFGEAFEEVHRWLDAFAGQPGVGMRHRRFRHHQAGVDEVRRLFGERAARAARQHVVSDLKEEGWTESDPFPADEAHYVRMGLY
jgi:hypothetical protein